MSMFDTIGNIRREQGEWRENAKQLFVPGIDIADLTIGQKITISPNLRLGDRSYTDVIHEVVAINSGHVQTRIPSWEKSKTRLVMLMVHEHHFYDATGFQTEPDDAT